MSMLLLIDDEGAIRRVLALSLRKDGYEVITAANGEEGIRMFLENRPPVVLTDIRMPGMDGIEVLKRIKEIESDSDSDSETEVIVVTGHGELELSIQALQLGASDFVTKPVNDAVLYVALKRAEERIELRKRLKECTRQLEKVKKGKLPSVPEAISDVARYVNSIVSNLEKDFSVFDGNAGDRGTDELRRALGKARRTVKEISELTMGLLDYTKECEPDCRKYSLNRIATEACDLMEPVARETGITVVRDFGDSIEVYVDPKGIRRCVMNLIADAIDEHRSAKNRRAGKTLEVRTFRNERSVGIAVSGTGEGPGESAGETAVSSPDDERDSDTGLKTFMAEKIIRAHDGRIAIESKDDSRSVFTIHLPFPYKIDP
ncbi:MAG: response regulator [Pseudomonadota bacterium]